MRPVDVKRLAAIVAATQANTLVYFKPSETKNLVSGGYVEFNDTMPDPADAAKFAHRATALGITAHGTVQPAAPRPLPAPGSFEIDDNVPMPASVGRVSRVPVYPFDKLNVGQSFHIPATADRPTPAKSMAGTVSSANRRALKLANGDANAAPKYTIKAAASDDVRGPGARVFRVA